MAETILQNWIFTRFGFPFLLVFFVVFAILEKTEILGKGKRQINALVAFVIGLIFVSVTYTVDVVTNLILFLTVGLVTMFVGILIWGFISGETKIESKGVKTLLGVIIFIGVMMMLLWATGFYQPIVDWLFGQDWSGPFWTNLLFIVMIAAAIAAMLKSGGAAKKD
jgi:hypothetical protein